MQILLQLRCNLRSLRGEGILVRRDGLRTLRCEGTSNERVKPCTTEDTTNLAGLEAAA